jgi:predicted membrane-bound spermidine synthase
MTTLTSNSSFESPLESRRYLPWLLILFVGSGCAALIYEIVWLQLLSLVIGSSGISLGVLLGTFMGGMCLGSLILPRLIPASLHPLRVYAVLELLIGILGLGVLFGMPYVADQYIHYGTHAIWVRTVVAAVCLVPPTLLMGATLPAIARWVETTPDGVSWMGFFYGGNIVGAVFGCVLAGFYLLRVFDMPTATYVAAGINLLVCIFGFILASQTPNVIPAADASVATDKVDSAGSGAVYLVIALSGLCALGAEVAWTRLLSLMLGATVYTFSIILAVFLVGLGIGSSVGAAAARSSRHPRAALGWCQIFIAGAIAWTAYQISHSLPYWPVDPQIELDKSLDHARAWLQFQLDVVRVAWAILPGAILWGASFPLALAGVATRGKDAGRMVGTVYAANTVGAIIGSLAFSMFIIPNQTLLQYGIGGTAGAQRVLIVLATISGIVALFPYIWPSKANEGEVITADEAARTEGAGLFSVGALVGVIIALGLIGMFVASIIPIPWIAVAFGRNSATWAKTSDPAMYATPVKGNIKGVNGTAVTLDENALTRSGAYTGMRLRAGGDWRTISAYDGGKRIATLDQAFSTEPKVDTQYSIELPTSGGYDRYAIYVGEGMNVSVAVTRNNTGWQYFHGAGKVQASSDPQDMRLQRMLGHISVLAHKDPDNVKDVLVVACGAGVTAGSFVPYPNVKNITICDIEPLVPTVVTPKFTDVNYGITDNITRQNPKKEMNGKTIEVAFDDGRHYIRTLPADKKYDIITSDPIDPWVKGCAALNTVQYYQMCKDHLKPGGVMSLWIPLYESDEETAKSVLATFFQVFPNGILWSNDLPGGEGYDAVLFGRAEDTQINIDEMAQRLDSEPYKVVKQSLLDVKFGDRRTAAGEGGTGADIAVDLLASFAGSAKDLTEWGKDAQINTDSNLRLQYLAGMAFNNYKAGEILNGILKYYKYPDKVLVGSTERVAQMRQALQEAGRTRFTGNASTGASPESIATGGVGQ